MNVSPLKKNGGFCNQNYQNWGYRDGSSRLWFSHAARGVGAGEHPLVYPGARILTYPQNHSTNTNYPRLERESTTRTVRITRGSHPSPIGGETKGPFFRASTPASAYWRPVPVIKLSTSGRWVGGGFGGWFAMIHLRLPEALTALVGPGKTVVVNGESTMSAPGFPPKC